MFKFLESAMELLVPIVVASMIDKGIYAENTRYVWYMGGALLGFAALGVLFAVVAQHAAAYAAVGVAKNVRRDLFIHIQGFSYSTLDRLGSATLVTRMTSDVNQVQSGVNLTLRLLLRSPFIVFGALVAAFLIDVQAAVVFSISIPLLAAAIFAVSFVTIPLYKKVQGKTDNVLTAVRNNLTGARVIKAFGREDAEKEEFDRENSQLTYSQNKVGSIAAILNPVTYLIVNVAIVLIIKIGGDRIYKGDLTQGELVALYGYMSQILIELIKFANLIINLSKTAASLKRIEGIFDIEEEEDEPRAFSETSNSHIEFKNVCIRYENAPRDAASAINFTLSKGETLGIIGGTGSGKTTVINALPSFYEQRSGEIFVDGEDTRSMKKEDLRKKIAIVPQKATLFKGTIRENLLWGDEGATDEELWQALEYSQSADFVKSKEGGLDYLLTQNGDNLSGGQKQRLTIARALVKKPDILVLDDSSSALDYATDASLRQAISELPFKPTVIISSQRTTAVMRSDKILVLSDGEQVGLDSHENLLKNCETYREIYYSQFKKAAKNEEG